MGIRKNYVGIDIGGSWIKGVILQEELFEQAKCKGFQDLNIQKVPSPLSATAGIEDLMLSLGELTDRLGANMEDIAGIGISTAGIVDYAGQSVIASGEHLNILKHDEWINEIEKRFDCPVSLINDADAAAIGIAELGKLYGNQSVGIMPIGTGLGFSVWKNGRRWRPVKIPILLGSIETSNGSYNTIASTLTLASMHVDKKLGKIFLDSTNTEIWQKYIRDLAEIINTVAVLYTIDKVMICGGLADAVNTCSFPLEKHLNEILSGKSNELNHQIEVVVMTEGNLLPLIGALALIKGEVGVRRFCILKKYEAIESEKPYDKELELQYHRTEELLELFLSTEQEAGINLKQCLPRLAKLIDKIVVKLNEGGRIIYVGAGTSGRIAAMDAVEIPCTYGLPEDKIICLIAGGIADASLKIESDFEEDASSVPEMLLLNISSKDVVIGISASGSAHFVQSALAFSKSRGAYSVLIQNEDEEGLEYCHTIIPLQSGNEIVAGSTRMKAGTAIKKVLNFISSTAMVKLGKVVGPFMIDVSCINQKLTDRAQNILGVLYNMDKMEAYHKLKEADMNLMKAIQKRR